MLVVAGCGGVVEVMCMCEVASCSLGPVQLWLVI